MVSPATHHRLILMETFATESQPLRPSSLGKLMKCPMSVLLSLGLESEGNSGAHTGNLVHDGIEAFHRGKDGAAAVVASASEFPKGDLDKALHWYRAYAADPTNRDSVATLGRDWLVARLLSVGFGSTGSEKNIAEDRQRLEVLREAPEQVPAVEVPVRLVLPGGIYVHGTLDQIRKGSDFKDAKGDPLPYPLVVADAKTGSFLKPEEKVDEHQFQQACYTLAARQTLGLDVYPGGIIDIAGYDQPRGRRFIPNGLTIRDCEELMLLVQQKVEAVRRGAREYTPSADGCKFCPFKRFPSCKGKS